MIELYIKSNTERKRNQVLLAETIPVNIHFGLSYHCGSPSALFITHLFYIQNYPDDKTKTSITNLKF